MIEGRYEIEAAKQRLIFAKKQASVASTNMESAKAMMESATAMMERSKEIMEASTTNMKNAESQLKSTTNEVDAAEKLLADAEKRWEVVEIDDNDSPTKDEGSDKRRKVSLSPQRDISNNAARKDASSSTGQPVGSRNDGGGGGGGTGTTYNNRSNSNNIAGVGGHHNMNMNSAVATQNSGVAYTIIVDGCGMHGVNGVYTRSQTHLQNGFPIFYKQGNSMGPDFHIVCNDVGPGPNHYMSWSIGMRGFPLFLYQSISEPSWVVGQDPSKCSSWVSTPVGIYPPPQVIRG